MDKKDLFFVKIALVNFAMWILLLIRFFNFKAFKENWFIYLLPALLMLVCAGALGRTKNIPIVLVKILQYLMPIVFLGIILLFIKFNKM